MNSKITNQLLIYLKEVFKYENSLYSIEKIKQDIEQKKLNLGISKKDEIYPPQKPDDPDEKYKSEIIDYKEPIVRALFWPFQIFFPFVAIFIFAIVIYLVTTKTKLFFSTLIITYFVIAFIMFIYSLIQEINTSTSSKNANEEMFALYHRDLEQYKYDMKNYEQLIQDDNIRVKRENIVKKYYEMEIQRFNELEIQTNKVLNTLYDLNVVYPKYRNHIAVATFLEYLQSGRCGELKGTYGAYNLYENECKQDLIINNLNKIVNTLEVVKNNQYMIYTGISESNRLTYQASLQLDNIKQDIISGQRNVQESNELAAFYSRETARNTELLLELNRDENNHLKTKGGYNID